MCATFMIRARASRKDAKLFNHALWTSMCQERSVRLCKALNWRGLLTTWSTTSFSTSCFPTSPRALCWMPFLPSETRKIKSSLIKKTTAIFAEWLVLISKRLETLLTATATGTTSFGIMSFLSTLSKRKTPQTTPVSSTISAASWRARKLPGCQAQRTPNSTLQMRLKRQLPRQVPT